MRQLRPDVARVSHAAPRLRGACGAPSSLGTSESDDTCRWGTMSGGVTSRVQDSLDALGGPVLSPLMTVGRAGNVVTLQR